MAIHQIFDHCSDIDCDRAYWKYRDLIDAGVSTIFCKYERVFPHIDGDDAVRLAHIDIRYLQDAHTAIRVISLPRALHKCAGVLVSFKITVVRDRHGMI